MAKYYVTSGVLRNVITADSAYEAALVTLQAAMDVQFVFDDDANAFTLHDSFEMLGKQMLVSERGFGQDEAGNWSTERIMDACCQLIIATDRLVRKMTAPRLTRNGLSDVRSKHILV